jgi:hypothetical protein
MGWNNLFLLALFGPASAGVFEVRSKIIKLRPGEVHNNILEPIPLPDDIKKRFGNSSMSVTNYSMEIVHVDPSGKETPAPLYHVYHHHYILYMGSAGLMQQMYEFLSQRDPLSGQPCNNTPSSLNTMLPKRTDIQEIVRAAGAQVGKGGLTPNPY